MRRFNSTSGSALLSALFIMTLVAIAATAMSTRLQLDIYRTRMTILSDRLHLASQIVPFWAMSELSNPRKKFQKADSQGKVMDFPDKLQTIYPTVRVTGAIYDLQARFNLNNVGDKLYYPIFLNLLKLSTPSLSTTEQRGLAEATKQWISPYQPGRGNDEFVQYYLKQKPPYHQSQQLMQSISEFRLVRGVDAKMYEKLSGILTTLPETTPININTAQKELIQSLGSGLNDSQMAELLSARENGVKNLQKISSILQKLNIRNEIFTLESQYFLSVANVSSDDLSMIEYCIFKRSKDKKGKISLIMISESVNAL